MPATFTVTMTSDIQDTRVNQQAPEPAKRPFLVTLLAGLVLIMASTNLVRFVEALSQWEFLSSLPRVSPAYLVISGLFWFLIGFPLAWGLWRGHPQAPKATRIVALAYTAYYWLDRALLANVGVGQFNLPFAAGLTILLLILIFWMLARTASKVYFGEVHD